MKPVSIILTYLFAVLVSLGGDHHGSHVSHVGSGDHLTLLWKVTHV